METALDKKTDAVKSDVVASVGSSPLSQAGMLGSPAGMPRFLQAKLVIGSPGDPYEQEADQVAGSIAGAGAVPRAGDATTVIHSGSQQHLQPKCNACATGQTCSSCQARQDQHIQAKPLGAALSRQPAQSVIKTTDAGAPLSSSVRERVEPTLGTDLSDVKVHSDASANKAAKNLGAKAFTHQNHIWLGPQQSPDDVELMAHEATHVVQQSADGGDQQTIQRAPADYQHAEDGGAVAQRMQAHINEALGDSQEEGTSQQSQAGDNPAPATGDGAAENHEAAQASSEIDRGELEEKKAELQPEARPDVNRPAEEAPKVEQAASATQEVAESPAEPLAEGDQAEEGGGEGEEAVADAEQASSLADQAFAAASSQPEPSPETPVVPPSPVAPVDAAGMPLPDDPETDLQVAGLADRAQVLREEGHRLRMLAREERGNAETLRGNIELVRTGVGQAEQGVTKSNEHLAFRQQTVGQAREALSVSQQKASTVAEQAPEFSSKADEGKQDSGPMASEAGQMAAENAANTPDDSEAAANAQEQGGKINQAGTDIATTDDAVTQTREKAGSLGEDAARAAEMNEQTQTKIDATDETIAQTGDKLSQMGEQSTQARGDIEGMASQPDQLASQAAAIDERGAALIQASSDMESQLQQTQTGYEQGMKAVPGVKMMEETEEQPIQMSPDSEPAVIQMSPEDGAQEVPAETALSEDQSPPTSSGVDAEMPQGEAASEEMGADAGPQGAPVQQTAGEGRYEDRANVDVTGALTDTLPSWMTGVDPVSEQQREEARLAEQERRQTQINQINEMANGRFEDLSATDKMGIALRLTGRNLFGSVGNIKWPGFGHLAAGLIDPRGPLMGVVGGLSMMISGGANLFSAEQRSKDPLGNLLKSAADIATGLTIILGSITALAGLIIGIMTAITILSFGTAAPITGPVIAFCTTVLTTVGGWTIAVGKVALVLQALVFIKNLIDAATAKTAEDLQNQSDQMTQDVSNAGNVVMQIGMAKLAQIGGRAATKEIVAARGGVRYAAGMGARAAAGARALPGRLASGVRGLPGRLASGARGLPGRIASGARALGGRGAAAAKGLSGRIASGARALPGRIAGGLRALPGRIARAPGQLIKGAKALPGRLRDELRTGFRRDFLLGEDIASFGGAKAASSETRAAVFAEANEASAAAKAGAAESAPSSHTAAEEPASTGPRPEHEPPTTQSERELLGSTAAKEGADLSQQELRAELDAVGRAKPRKISGGEYVEEVELPNGHTWRRNKAGRWCRFSNGHFCTTELPGGTPAVSAGEGTAAETTATPATETPTPAQPKPQAGLPEVPDATSRQVIDLTGDNWKNAEFANPDEGVIYILRDRRTGEILKTGKTEVSTIQQSRLGPYARAGRKTQRELEMELVTVPESSTSTFQSVEGQVRETLEGQGEILPWDQTGQRLGREGPGVPGSPLRRELRERGWRWKLPEGILVDKNGNPV